MELMIFLIACALLSVGVILVLYRKYNVQKALQLPTNPVRHPDSAIQSAKEIGKFLFERADICGIYYLSSDECTGITINDIHDLAEGKNRGVINLIRMAHYLGCEVVIRQVGTNDTEAPATTPQVYAEYIADLYEQELRRNRLR